MKILKPTRKERSRKLKIKHEQPLIICLQIETLRIGFKIQELEIKIERERNRTSAGGTGLIAGGVLDGRRRTLQA